MNTPAPPTMPVRVELLRLLHANGPGSLLAGGLLSVIVAWGLSYSSPLGPLLAWSVLVWIVAAVVVLVPLRYHGSREPEQDEPASRRNAILGYTVFGMAWGLLPWLVMDATKPLITMVIMCMAAGLIAGAMAFMSPVWPAFAGFALFVALPLALKLVTLGGVEHYALALAAVLYWITLLAQARSAAHTYRDAIELRFKNEALLVQLRDEKARAEEANLAKSKFLAAASHDLRQPIHAQGLFLEVLATNKLTAHQQEVLANVRTAWSASGEMLNTLLDFSRIEAGVVAPQAQAFQLQPLLHKIEVELAPQADSKGLIYRSRDTGTVAHSDAALVGLILRNLVSNAIRYTERGGVLVACRKRGGMLVVEVRDTGIGIAPEHQEAVFQEFHQLGNPERDRRKGLGLGLAIARGLARTLGHTLTLDSRVGCGSVFRLTLPLTAAAPSTPAAPFGMAPLARPAATHLQDVCVLVIDDDETVRTGMLQLLRGWGAECFVAESIATALAVAKEHPPALVISDYRLREQRTGAQAIAALRGVYGAGLPALLITGDTAPERLREAQASGVPLLHKPVASDDLLFKIHELLNENSKHI